MTDKILVDFESFVSEVECRVVPKSDENADKVKIFAKNLCIRQC